MDNQIDICIPTYNSAEYLKICLDSIIKNSKMAKVNIFVHDNGSTDNTQELLKQYPTVHVTRSDTNLGFCGVNQAIKAGKANHVMILNSDMYVLPYYDLDMILAVTQMERSHHIYNYTLSARLIEPVGNNSEYVISYHGHDAASFNEQSLIDYYNKSKGLNDYFYAPDTVQYSHPILFPRQLLERMNYLDESYFPGWAVDHDIAAAAYKAGARHFKMLGKARVFHFSSKTFTKLSEDVRSKHGEDIFERKWKISVREFRRRLGVTKPFARSPEGVLDV